MKTYKINRAEAIGNVSRAKSGIKWRYAGKTSDTTKEINDFINGVERYKGFYGNGSRVYIGLRLTDIETNEIVYEEMI